MGEPSGTNPVNAHDPDAGQRTHRGAAAALAAIGRGPMNPMLTRRNLILTILTTLTTLAIGAAATMREDDLTDLFTTQPGPAQPIHYRQGTILTFNPTTLENTVQVGKTTFQNLPVLGVAEAATYQPGTKIGIATVDNVWCIIGRFVIPGTPDATNAITLIGQRRRTAVITTQQSTSSASFVDLTTVGPTIADVLVPASGKIQVTLFANLGGPANSMSPRITGATTIEPSTQRSLAIAAAGFIGSAVLLYENLPIGGLVTFTMKYRSNGVDQADFSDRTLIVEAL